MFRRLLAKIKSQRSLKLILFCTICSVGIIPGIILSATYVTTYESQAVSSRTKMVQNQCLIQANHLYTSGYLDNMAVGEDIDLQLTQLSNLYDGRVMIIDSDYRIIKDTYSLSEGKFMIAKEVNEGFNGNSVTNYDKENRFIEVVTPITDRSGENVLGVMLTSVSTEEIALILGKIYKNCNLILVALCAIIIGVALAATRLLVKPLVQLSNAIDNIREGFLQEEIPASPYKEVMQIREAFDHMFSRMKALDDSRSEFVSNVSHELKTPITSIKVLAESLTSGDDVPVEIYREFMEDIVVEVDREDKIINNLLSLVKMDKAGVNLCIEKVDIDLLLEDIIKRLAPIAQKAHVEIIYETVRGVVAEVDPTKLALAFSNIIENGIKYNLEGGSVKVILDAEPLMFTVTVSDTGVGIGAEDLPNIFERFYRADKSHSREIGGTGLGLAIARGAIIMHKGAIKVDSEPSVGTVFTIKIPINHIESGRENQENAESVQVRVGEEIK